MSREWWILAVALVTTVVLGAVIYGATRSGASWEGSVFLLGTFSLLATGSLLVLKVPRTGWLGCCCSWRSATAS